MIIVVRMLSHVILSRVKLYKSCTHSALGQLAGSIPCNNPHASFESLPVRFIDHALLCELLTLCAAVWGCCDWSDGIYIPSFLCVTLCNAATSITAMCVCVCVCVYLCHAVIYSSLLSHQLSCIHTTHLLALVVYT